MQGHRGYSAEGPRSQRDTGLEKVLGTQLGPEQDLQM